MSDPRSATSTAEIAAARARVAELEALVLRLAARVHAAHEVIGRLAERKEVRNA